MFVCLNMYMHDFFSQHKRAGLCNVQNLYDFASDVTTEFLPDESLICIKMIAVVVYSVSAFVSFFSVFLLYLSIFVGSSCLGVRFYACLTVYRKVLSNILFPLCSMFHLYLCMLFCLCHAYSLTFFSPHLCSEFFSM